MNLDSAEKIKNRLSILYPTIAIHRAEILRCDDKEVDDTYYISVDDRVLIDQTYWIVYEGTQHGGDKNVNMQYDMYNDQLYDYTTGSDRYSRFSCIDGFLTNDFNHKEYDYTIINLAYIIIDLMGKDKEQWV